MITESKRQDMAGILIIEQIPCGGIYPNVTGAYIGDIITFFISMPSYPVEIRDQNYSLIGTAYSPSFNWDTTGWTAGIYNINATANGCSASIPIPISLVTACTSVDISADNTSAFIGDMVTFTATVQPVTESYPVEIIDQDNHLVAPICVTSSGVCTSSWDTTGRTVGTYNIRVIVGKCARSISITLLPACTSVTLSVDKASAYIGDMVTFAVTVQPSAQSYPVEIRDHDNNLIGACETNVGMCYAIWDTTGVAAKSYIIIAKAAGRCISTPVVITLEKNPLGIISVLVGGITAAAIIYMVIKKRPPKEQKMEVHISK